MTLAHVDLILDGVHVLVVEDSIDAREAIRTTLQYCGALVTAASSTAEAHRSLEILRPHVLVTDVGCPMTAFD
jgi:CheY-like chemotaxis protein